MITYTRTATQEIKYNPFISTLNTAHPKKPMQEDERRSAKIEGSETSSVGSVVGYTIFVLILVGMGGAIVFVVIRWRKTRSIPFLTKPYLSNEI